MRTSSQVENIVGGELASLLFALDATIVSVSGGVATIQPVPRRIFPDNDEVFKYPPVPNVRLLSLVFDDGKSGVSGRVKPGDPCLLIAISHTDAGQPDHKHFSACCALTGFSDASAYPMPDSVGLRIFHAAAFITLDDNNINIENGGGSKLVFDGGGITMTAPEGYTVNGKTKFNDDVVIAGGLSQTAREDGGVSKAKFAGDVEIKGTSTATDHLSGEISGKDHEHPNGDNGNPTGKPTP